MAVLGFLLLIGVVGAAIAVAWTNQSAIEAGAGTLNIFGEQVNLTVGRTFLFGAAAGAVALLALNMMIGGTRRRVTRSAQRRRDERELQSRLAESDAASRAAVADRVRTDRAAARAEEEAVRAEERRDAYANR